MGEYPWASGRWYVKEGMVDEFIERWKAWLSWTSESCPGFRSATLLQADDDPRRFTSISDWDDEASRRGWMTSAGFQERIEPVKDACEDFHAGSYHVAADFSGPGS
jgi:heme-degrading monooxygenase HmoA